jgi:hypothetical protein
VFHKVKCRKAVGEMGHAGNYRYYYNLVYPTFFVLFCLKNYSRIFGISRKAVCRNIRKWASPPSSPPVPTSPCVRVAAPVSRLDGISGAPNLANRGDLRYGKRGVGDRFGVPRGVKKKTQVSNMRKSWSESFLLPAEARLIWRESHRERRFWV